MSCSPTVACRRATTASCGAARTRPACSPWRACTASSTRPSGFVRLASRSVPRGPCAGRDVRRGVDVTVRKDSVLDWLLEASDPGVRFFALRELLGAPPDDKDLRAARRATVRHPPVRPILEAMKDEGYWVNPFGGYTPKYTGTLWQVIFLGQFGADSEDPRIHRAADYVLDRSRAPLGRFSATSTARKATPAGMLHCLEGNLGASLLELGFGDDPRLKEALNWLARSITGEGLAPASSKNPV